MDDALRVDHNIYPVDFNIEQPAGLDHFQPFIKERGGINRDLPTHRPGWVAQSLFRCHKRELGGAWGDRLMTKVQAFAAKCPPGSSHPECQFPALAGSHLSPDDLGSPALAFVRTACHLLGLDAAVADEVSLSFLKGAVIEFEDSLMRSAFHIASNPNSESTCGCGSSFVAKG